MRLKSLDQILLVLLFLVGAISTVQLFSREDRSSNLDSIAVIVSEINTVKRKTTLFDSWRELSLGDTLQENDQIYTHDRSEVELKFNSGKKIQLLENSLLKLSKDKDRESLKLERGIIEARFDQEKNNQPLKIDFKGKTVFLDSNSGIVQMESTKEGGKIYVQSGELTISDGKNNTIIKENQSISHEKNGVLGKVVDTLFLLKNPKNKTKILKSGTNAEVPVEFQWSNNRKVRDEISVQYTHKLLISTSYDFKNIFKIININLEKNSTTVDFTESGKYFWKIRSTQIDSGEILDSITRLIEILPVSSGYITTTQDIFVKKSKKSSGKSLVKIDWKNPMSEWIISQKLFLKYKNELINTVALNKNVLSYGFSLEQELVNAGDYSVVLETQLKAQNNLILKTQSAPFEFKIIENQVPVIKIKNPKKETIFNYKKQGMQKLLGWDVLSGAGSYEVLLFKKNVQIFNAKTFDSFIDIPLNEEGTYKWKITPYDSENRRGEEHVGEITLKYPKKLNALPKSGEILYLETPDQEVQFKWEKSSKASSFVFELSESPEFNQLIHTNETTKNNYITRLGKSGNFYWRVKVKIGELIEYSEPVSVEVKPAPIFEKPIIEEEIKLQLQKMDTSLIKAKVPGTFKFIFKLVEKIFAQTIAQNEVTYKVEWKLKPLKNVKKYIVEIYRSRDLKELVLKEEVSQPSFVWKNAISGTFFWRLAYRDEWDRITEFSNLSKLVIEPIQEKVENPKIIEIEEKIELVLPKHREEIKSINDNENVFEGNWIFDPKKADKKPNVEMLFAYDLDFEQIYFKKNVNIEDSKLKGFISCDDLAKIFPSEKKIIDFYWRIKNNKTNVESKRRYVTLHLEKMCPTQFANQMLSVKEQDVHPIKENRFIFNNRYSLGFIPAQINLETKGSGFQAKANGVSFFGVSVTGEKFVNENLPNSVFGLHSFYGEFKYLSGKIFASEKLQNISIETGSRILSYLKLGAILKKQTELVEVNQNRIVGDVVTLFGISANLEHQFSLMRWSFNLQGGNYLGYALEVQRDFEFKKIPFIVGLSYQGLSFKKEDKISNQNVVGLKLHYLFN